LKKEVPIAIGLIAGLLWLISTYFTGPSILATVHTELNNWFLLVQGWMVLVGVINITRVHGHRIAQKRKDWIYSIVAVAGMYGIMLFGIFVAKQANDPNWKIMYNQIIAPMNATVYSTLVFYIASASYRAFRVRNLQASILLVSAVLMMVGRVPLGERITRPRRGPGP
jgi:glucan phosphoethanolaminetransferase (alkaline phosphatase superfamily)